MEAESAYKSLLDLEASRVMDRITDIVIGVEIAQLIKHAAIRSLIGRFPRRQWCCQRYSIEDSADGANLQTVNEQVTGRHCHPTTKLVCDFQVCLLRIGRAHRAAHAVPEAGIHNAGRVCGSRWNHSGGGEDTRRQLRVTGRNYGGSPGATRRCRRGT